MKLSRKLFKNGDSLAITIPAPIIKELSAKNGTELSIDYNDKTKTVTLERSNDINEQ